MSLGPEFSGGGGAANGAPEFYIPNQNILPLPNFLPSLTGLLENHTKNSARKARRSGGGDSDNVMSLGPGSGQDDSIGREEEGGHDAEIRAVKRRRGSADRDTDQKFTSPPILVDSSTPALPTPARSPGSQLDAELQMAAMNLVTFQKQNPRA